MFETSVSAGYRLRVGEMVDAVGDVDGVSEIVGLRSKVHGTEPSRRGLAPQRQASQV